MRKPTGPGPLQGKLWGTTQPLFDYNGVELHKMEAKKGGYCSIHYHDYKWNRFIVISGKIKVTIYEHNEKETQARESALTFPEHPIEDVTILEAGMASDVPPRKWHIFEAIEDSLALECYWVEMDPYDIVRRSVGGMRESDE